METRTRSLVLPLLGMTLLCACASASAPQGRMSASTSASTSAPRQSPSARGSLELRGRVSVYSWFDLPDDPRSRELSGIAWDDATHTLWAVQDESARIVPILPDQRFQRWGFGPIVSVDVSFPLDLEGIVLLRDGFIVASEKGPRVIEVDRRGKLRRDIALPEHFASARDNKSLESLTMSPDGTYLFTTSEGALGCDGPMPTKSAGTRLRILRMSPSGEGAEEHAYLTDPLPSGGGDYGVADLAAISNDEVLVLERGWAHGFGNTARIYRARLTDPVTSCTANPALAPNVPFVKKELLVDLSTLATSGLPPPKQVQASALLDNYEGLCVGPILPDGRRTLVLISDDNNRSDQFSRILVLAVE